MKTHNFCIFLINIGLKVGVKLEDVYDIVYKNLEENADKTLEKLIFSKKRYSFKRQIAIMDTVEFLWNCEDALEEIKLSN